MGLATKPAETGVGTTDPLDANLSWLLSQASHVLTTQMTAALEDMGLSPRSYCLLSTAQTGTFTQIELADAVGLDKTTMVVTLDALEAAGLAKRSPSPHDRRARVVEVTRAGRRKVAQAEAIVDRVHADVLAELPARDRKVFVESLLRLVGDRLSTPSPCAHPVRRRVP